MGIKKSLFVVDMPKGTYETVQYQQKKCKTNNEKNKM